jgi:hypothetical protein
MLGWLNTLFAYVDDPPRRNTFPTFDGSGFAGTCLDNLPHGRTCVPFTWNQLGTPVGMELVGGMWGVTQDAQGALGVASGWLVSLARGVPPDPFTEPEARSGCGGARGEPRDDRGPAPSWGGPNPRHSYRSSHAPDLGRSQGGL